MTSIRRAECEEKASERAKESDYCAHPIPALVEVAGRVRIALSPQNFLTCEAIVSDESGKRLAVIKMGEPFSFECASPQNLTIKTMSLLGRPVQVVANPGESYEIRVHASGQISLVTVDCLG